MGDLSPIEIVAAAEAVAQERIAATSVDDVRALMPTLTDEEARLIHATVQRRVRVRTHAPTKR
ncbi:hypothetical protein DN546_31140 [Burkholderia multivorans]|uniref:hypothetical protein n=1 Tax=Burkholderia multivorans TaxID=87883 RepID=UPI000DAB89E4|nr:hypothetical protein [Burkholderia multivorans]RAA53761.1 hypothetical protein DN479_31000 [Burkholderia multivorans]RAA70678.1 hypothetical protein DN468_31135 [Burkholderia multivorans]RAD79751.1 hypothetical protein DN508_31925 [Burkholderia multivorans]RAE97192.1 hypothetical protein DN545_38090 [Burkholderia multivorans]RAF76580.1 hypothetical protein DN546_31140 [Burkholderia multivorans]